MTTPAKSLPLIALCLLLAGCAAAQLMEADMKAPAHTHYDFETGGYQADPGWHWEDDPANPNHQHVVKDAEPTKEK